MIGPVCGVCSATPDCLSASEAQSLSSPTLSRSRRTSKDIMALASSSILKASPRLEQLKAAPRKPGEASFFFYDAHFKNDAVKILPGEYFVYDEDILIMTTLGSCIAACIWDRSARVGGMNHFMLPEGSMK